MNDSTWYRLWSSFSNLLTRCFSRDPKVRTFSWITMIPILGLGNPGCVGTNFGYILSVGAGQLGVLTHAVPLDEVLDDPDLDPERHEKLLWIQQVRDYAKNDLGLAVRKSYNSYYDTGDGPAVYNLSASRKDALEPVSWSFPIIGRIQYLGFFKFDHAEKKAQKLQDQGYDVTIYGAIAYSTLGYFKDPIYSSILDLDKAKLAELVCHELTHNTVYKNGDSEFNESLATFVGKKGAMLFITKTLGADSEFLSRTQSLDEDEQAVTAFLDDLYQQLDAYYARTDLTSDEKIAGREDIFQSARDRFKNEIAPALHEPDRYSSVAEMPTSNAWILLHHRYNKDMGIFEDVFQACADDLPAAVKIFKQAEDADDSYQYLRDWVNNQKK